MSNLPHNLEKSSADHNNGTPDMNLLTWVSACNGEIPPHAVQAGRDVSGRPLYAGRCHHKDDLLPCKISPEYGLAYTPVDGKEITVNKYEALVFRKPTIAWVSASNGQVPDNAIVAGKTSDGEKLYIGRAQHWITSTPGKVHPSRGCLCISFGGKEFSYKEYEVAVLTYETPSSSDKALEQLFEGDDEIDS